VHPAFPDSLIPPIRLAIMVITEIDEAAGPAAPDGGVAALGSDGVRGPSAPSVSG